MAKQGARDVSIAAITTLGDNLIRAKMLPLNRIPSLSVVVLVTDQPGPPIPKVRYVVPPKWLYRVTMHKSVAKLVALMFTVWRCHPKIVMAYNVLPHGYSAWLVARVFRKAAYQHLIGGVTEVRPALGDNGLVQRFPAMAPVFAMLNKWVIRHSDAVCVPGAASGRFVALEARIPEERVFQLHSAIDTARFTPDGSTVEFDVITAAALTQRKRIDLFLRAVALVKERLPGVKAAILGAGPLLGMLRKLAEHLGISPNVVFLGFRANVETYYRRARVFVLTSSVEGLSCAAMEAMSCGLPIVAADAGDMGEVAIDGVTGYVIRDRDAPESYARRIVELLEDDELRERCSRNSVALIAREHSIASVEKEWLRILAFGGAIEGADRR